MKYDTKLYMYDTKYDTKKPAVFIRLALTYYLTTIFCTLSHKCRSIIGLKSPL